MLHKNWKAICECPDPRFRWALALLDLESDFAKALKEALPMYFSDEPQAGPIPLSVIRKKAFELSAADDGVGYDDCLLSDGACAHFEIPARMIYTEDAHEEHRDPEGEVLTKNEEALLNRPGEKIGEVVEFRGERLVIVEIAHGEFCALAPAELIAVDC